MKTTILLSLLSFTLFAGDFGVRCLSAGGFYGNIAISETEQGFQLEAYQGYSHSMGQKLGMDYVSGIKVLFPKESCKFGAKTAAGSTPTLCELKDAEVEFIGIHSGLTVKNMKFVRFDLQEIVAHSANGSSVTVAPKFTLFDKDENGNNIQSVGLYNFAKYNKNSGNPFVEGCAFAQ